MSAAPSYRLDRGLLPMPVAYLARQNLLISKPRAEWGFIRCPAHHPPDTTGTVRVSLNNGSYRCKVCGTRGRDILDLHMLITGRTFIQTAAELCGSGGND